jgi:uncharacterized protein YdeI (YjbR/CyaY-like superfamily)
MTAAGLQKVADARRSGQWRAARERERTDRPAQDLRRALHARPGAWAGYRQLPGSRRKQLLYLLSVAKKPETRRKRIEAIVAEAAANASG